MVGDSSFTRQKSWSFLNQKKIPHRVSSEHSHFIDGGVEAGRSSSNCLKSELDTNRAGPGSQNAFMTQAGLLSA